MKPIDAVDLSWFMSEGIAAFERSTQGESWERASLAVGHQELREVNRADPLHCGVEVTAWPTAPRARQEPGYTPSDALLFRYGSISRRLLRVGQRDAVARDVLGLYFGVDGTSWASHKRGRHVALFLLVPSGRELIARARRGGSSPELSDREILRVEVELDQVRSGDVTCMRHVLLTRAQREAEALYARAERVWEEAQ